ncbi:MAG: chemotaxis protein CheA, partial [Gammaproteobacteria bacterium]
DLITDDEFEAVLDGLHGAGRFDVAKVATAPAPVEGVAATAPPAPREPAGRTTPAAGGAAKETTVRVETEVLDRIMNMVGELVLIRNRLTNLQAVLGDEDVTQTVANLDVVTSDLQMAAMKTRMQPIKKVFGRFPRVVRDLARSLDKQIALVMRGEETDLDKNLVEALADPLVHLVRNAIDHGIEMPADRVAAGKAAQGTLELSAEQAGDQIQLVIRDDGKGIDAEALRRKAVASNLLEEDAAARLSVRECFELIFLPGFSTKQEISDISGRGVGMDVVKTRITQLNGTIAIDSELGRGTTITINVPLTLAIMPTLMVVLGSQVFALPLVNVQEIINFEAGQAREVDGRKTLVVRGRAIPLFYLSHWLVRDVRDFAAQNGHVVVVRIGNQSVGLLVDELIGQEEVVIKPLGALLHGTKGFAGATITGNGKIALIIDLPGLLAAYARR